MGSGSRQQVVSPKVTYLDGLRGVAAFVVLLAHFKELFLPGTAVDDTPLMFLVASNLAVLVFFVHSGFVLSWKYLSIGDIRVLVSMGIRRPLRLGIPIAVAVVFAWTLMRADLMTNSRVASLTGSRGSLLQLYDFEPTLYSATVDALGGVLFFTNYRYNGAFWTMPIELLCSYAVFFVLPFVLRTATPTLVLLLFVGVLATINSYPWLTCFMAGIFLVRLQQEGIFREEGVLYHFIQSNRLVTPAIWVVVVSLALWPGWIAAHLSVPGFLGPPRSLEIVSAVLLVVLLLTSRRFQTTLDSPVARQMGRMSFAVYLLHLPVLCSASSGIYLGARAAQCPPWLNLALTFLATVVIVYSLSFFMAKYVDRFAIDAGKRALDRRLYGAPS